MQSLASQAVINLIFSLREGHAFQTERGRSSNRDNGTSSEFTLSIRLREKLQSDPVGLAA